MSVLGDCSVTQKVVREVAGAKRRGREGWIWVDGSKGEGGLSIRVVGSNVVSYMGTWRALVLS